MFLILIFSSKINSHPDGAIPYWYPSSYIFGFVNGCADTVEKSGVFSNRFWPNEIRSICGCVVDSLRHSLTFEEVNTLEADNKTTVDLQTFVAITMPLCVNEKSNR